MAIITSTQCGLISRMFLVLLLGHFNVCSALLLSPFSFLYALNLHMHYRDQASQKALAHLEKESTYYLHPPYEVLLVTWTLSHTLSNHKIASFSHKYWGTKSGKFSTWEMRNPERRQHFFF